MNIARVQGQQVALEVRIPRLHGEYVTTDFLDHLRYERRFVYEEVTIAGLIIALGQKIYLEAA